MKIMLCECKCPTAKPHFPDYSFPILSQFICSRIDAAIYILHAYSFERMCPTALCLMPLPFACGTASGFREANSIVVITFWKP